MDNYDSDGDQEYPDTASENSDINEEGDYGGSDIQDNVMSLKEENARLLQSISDKKFKILKDYDNNLLDIDVFFDKLIKTEKELRELQQEKLDIDGSLLDNELYFLELLETYKKNLKQKIPIPESFRQNLDQVYNNLKKVRESYSVEEIDPLESLDYNDTLEVKLDKLLELEEKQMKNIAKKIKIKIPLKKDYNNIEQYERANDSFYNKMLQYVSDDKEKLGVKIKKEYYTSNKDSNIKVSIKSTEDLLSELRISKQIVQPSKNVSEYIYKLINSKVKVPLKKDNNNNNNLRLISKTFVDVWRLPIKDVSTDKYIFKTFQIFEDYLVNLKVVIEQNITEFEYLYTNEQDISKKENLLRSINSNKDKIYKIHEFLDGGNGSVDTVSKRLIEITELKRKNTIKRLRKIINIPNLLFELEKYIYVYSKSPDVYYQKVENIIFILTNYENINKLFIEEKISISYLYNFEKEIIYPNLSESDILTWRPSNYEEQMEYSLEVSKSLNKISENPDSKEKILNDLKLFKMTLKSQRVIEKPDLELRKNVINLLNKLIFKKIVLQVESDILKKYISYKESQKIELLLYDNSNTQNDYLEMVNRVKSMNVKDLIQNKNKLLSFIDINNNIDNDSNKKQYLENYSEYSIKQLDSIISQNLNIIKKLKEDLTNIKSITDSGIFTIEWEPSNKIFNKYEIDEFNKLKKRTQYLLKLEVNKENMKRRIINLPELVDKEYLFFAEKITKKLNSYKTGLIKKHGMKIDSRIKYIEDEIENVNKINNKINKIKDKKIEILSKFQRKFKKPGIKQVNNYIKILTYGLINKDLINQVILSYKRSLFKNSLLKTVEYIDYLDSLLSHNLISREIYNNLFNYFISSIDYNNFLKLNNDNYKKGLEVICEQVLFIKLDSLLSNINLEINNENILQFIINQWPKEYQETENKILNTILEELLKYKDFSFYYSQSAKIIVQNEIKRVEYKNIPRYESIIYDPIKNIYGSNNGYLFKVYRFKNNVVTNLPLEEQQTVEDIVARTGRTIYKVVTFPMKGKDPFIKIKAFNRDYPEQVDYVWKLVPNKYVKLYPMNYDTCNIYKNENDCVNNAGLGNVKCKFINNKCIS